MAKIAFTKMHGTGNDYIYINGLDSAVHRPGELAKALSRRHFSIGADGLVLILPSRKADFRMRMFNADGSEAEMCGNAIRCVGKYLYDNLITSAEQLSIETAAGIRSLRLAATDGTVWQVEVNMGQPLPLPGSGGIIPELVRILDRNFTITPLSMGNPHGVIFTGEADLTAIPLEEWGAGIEEHPLFPGGVNVEFVHVINRKELAIRVRERGTGETLSCGTGACAAAFAAFSRRYTGRIVQCRLQGGVLNIRIAEDNTVFMTGDAETVFTGEVTI